MPEDTAGSDLEKVLEHLEVSLNTQNYQIIQNALEKSHGKIKVPVVEKLLNICVCDLEQEKKNAVNALNIVATVLRKNNAGELHETPDLVPSAIAVLHLIKTTAIVNNLEGVKKLCFEILLLYPNNVLISLVVSHSKEVMEIIDLYYHQRTSLEMRLQSTNLIFKILKTLPPDKRSLFVREGVDLWFTKMIPTVMAFMNSNTKKEILLDMLEMLTEELISVDYADNPNWQLVLQCIYTPQKYPAIMKNLLDAGSDMWYRLWIIFIKLLKKEITKNFGSVGSPINSMLPVVEAAFKMNVKNRCRAFQCWNVLIDNFSTETNDTYVNKRLKLLIIPLASNNAKVEETALSKLNTWWHLIRQFETKIKDYSDMVLLPFLHFCFGKPAVPEKPVFAPGLLNTNTKRQVLQVFANIAGHVSCECTVTMAKLHGKMLSYTLLIDHWKHWTNALTMTIRICINDDSDLAHQHFKCIWKSVVATIADISDSDLKNNMFFEILTILEVLLHSSRCEKLAGLVFIILTNSILNNNDEVLPLFKTGEKNTVNKIILLLLNPSLDSVYTRYGAKEIITKIMPLTKYFAQECLNLITENYLNMPLDKNNCLMLWTALSISLCESKCDINEEIQQNLLLFPLKSINLFASVESSVTAWISLYKHAKATLKESSALDERIYGAISEHAILGTANKQFIFLASLALLNNIKTTNGNEHLTCNIARLLENITYEIDLSFIEDNHKYFVNTLIFMLNIVINYNNEKLARSIVLIINDLLRKTFKYYNRNNIDDEVFSYTVKLIDPLNLLFKKNIYSTLKSIVIDELKKLMPYLKLSKQYNSSHEIIKDLINQNMDESETAILYCKQSVDNEKVNIPENSNKCTVPKIKDSSNNDKKKDADVLETVIENGEEYVVVKSNWKFNPKKLTDNQKEKLQRTREDIPALYQDLSQSQDEFKKVFTMNSVDSTTSSKSLVTEKEDVSTILKNMPSCNVLLTMIDTVKHDGTIKQFSHKTSHSSIETNSHKEKNVIDSESPKSPRVALKDRVFKNVKNLIEKSSLEVEPTEPNVVINDDILSTPPSKYQNNKIVNSAPTEINSERPSRLKRKPKKFEDLKPLLCKRHRNSTIPKVNIDNSKMHEQELTEKNENRLEDNVANVGKICNITNSNNLQVNDVNLNMTENMCVDQKEDEEKHEIKAKSFHNNVMDERIDVNDLKETDRNVDINLCENNSQAKGNSMELEICNLSDDVNLTNPKLNIKESVPKSENKKPGKRKSRIENELAIDMVEGHPFLKLQSEKRLTRKTVVEISASSVKRKTVLEKLSNLKDISKANTLIYEKQNDSPEDLTPSQSQDIIESSQDSSISSLPTLSVKVTKKISNNPSPLTVECPIKEPIDSLQNGKSFDHDSLNDFGFTNKNMSEQNIDDIELSRNKTVIQNSVNSDYTEEMDTELAENGIGSEEVNEIKDKNSAFVNVEYDTANAETQTLDSEVLLKELTLCNMPPITDQSTEVTETICNSGVETPILATLNLDTKLINNESDISKIGVVETDSSPFKDVAERQKDFMNNTLEISPIKTLSPVQEGKISPIPDTSNDFVVITLSSPVQSNGIPFDKSDSLEMFTNDKTSPDKRDQSPPRGEVVTNNYSPRSSLSLKKNRPQVWSGGRAAQMLVLCVPDTLPTIVNHEKSAEPEDNQKSIATNTSARRNLRILYNTTNENNDKSEENVDNECFLKLKKSLPTAESSPSGPILKRKLTDIIDETTISPASKRKRVSFHDPPVSTTICVKKYIEPSGIRSPQNSAIKRQERQLRASYNMKSTKKLDNIFKLDKVLTKTVESFMDNDNCVANDDIEDSLVEEVIKETDLNNTDPICPVLVNCKDPIDKIISELSSPSTKLTLTKEFEGTIATIGDLAKMSELEINRFCIESPKVQVAMKALADYASSIETLNGVETDHKEVMISSEFDGQSTDLLSEKCVMSDNKNGEESNISVQTEVVSLTLPSTQTDSLQICNIATQTTNPEEESTSNLILSTLSTRPDFVSLLYKHLDESSKQEIANELSLTALTDTLTKKLDTSDKLNTISSLLDQCFKCISSEESNARLSVLRNYLCAKFDSKDLILFCSDILRQACEKPL